MNGLSEVNIVTMDKDAALRKFEEYKAAVKRSHGAADRLIAKVYKSLSEGAGVLNLREALSKGGVDPKTWLPKLAAMRADQPMVYFRRRWEGEGLYSYSERYYLSSRLRKAQAARLQFVAPIGSLPEAELHQRPREYSWTHSAPVPPIPPQFRPADALSKYVILWEVSEWSPVRPPDDPILLKPLAGDMYAVLAHWDLTDVEKMVLGSLLAQGQ